MNTGYELLSGFVYVIWECKTVWVRSRAIVATARPADLLHLWVLECILTAGSALVQQRKTHPRGQAIALFVRKRDPLCVSYWNSVKKCLTHLWVITLPWNKPWCWERLRAGEGGDRGWDGQRASSTQWAWVWADLGDSEGQGSRVWCSPWGRKESDMT